MKKKIIALSCSLIIMLTSICQPVYANGFFGPERELAMTTFEALTVALAFTGARVNYNNISAQASKIDDYRDYFYQNIFNDTKTHQDDDIFDYLKSKFDVSRVNDFMSWVAKLKNGIVDLGSETWNNAKSLLNEFILSLVGTETLDTVQKGSSFMTTNGICTVSDIEWLDGVQPMPLKMGNFKYANRNVLGFLYPVEASTLNISDNSRPFRVIITRPDGQTIRFDNSLVFGSTAPLEYRFDGKYFIGENYTNSYSYQITLDNTIIYENVYDFVKNTIDAKTGIIDDIFPAERTLKDIIGVVSDNNTAIRSLSDVIEGLKVDTWDEAIEKLLVGSKTAVLEMTKALDLVWTKIDTLENTIFNLDDRDDDGKPLPFIPDFPDGKDFKLSGLEKVFPFCLPFDFVAIVKKLNAEPSAPIINVNIRPINYRLHIDLNRWNSVAELFRNIEVIMLIVGLALNTRNIIRG